MIDITSYRLEPDDSWLPLLVVVVLTAALILLGRSTGALQGQSTREHLHERALNNGDNTATVLGLDVFNIGLASLLNILGLLVLFLFLAALQFLSRHVLKVKELNADDIALQCTVSVLATTDVHIALRKRVHGDIGV